MLLKTSVIDIGELCSSVLQWSMEIAAYVYEVTDWKRLSYIGLTVIITYMYTGATQYKIFTLSLRLLLVLPRYQYMNYDLIVISGAPV